MANSKHHIVHSLFITSFCALALLQESTGSGVMELRSLPTGYHISSPETELKLKYGNKRDNAKGSLIGSVVPSCTYNECKDCKYKCRAKQVPVEGNDPNSAYHYKCVCHK